MGGRPARWVLAVVLVLLGTGFGGRDAAQAGARVVAFGDSYVNPGPRGLSAGQRSWLPALGEPVRNLGRAGDGVAATLSRVRRATGTTIDVAVVAVGINDVCRGGTDPGRLARFRADYREVLQRLAAARLVVVVPPLPVRAWGRHGSEAALVAHRDVVLRLAEDLPRVRVADPLPAWRPDTMLMGDGLHPNALGRAAIAAAVRAALAP